MKELITVGVEAAKKAGAFLLEHFGNVSTIESKGDRNLATDVDKAAERMITEKILAAFPTHGIIGEEEGTKTNSSDYLWVIDPLDGTHNYIRGINIFGVSLGILCKEQFVGGIVYMPVDDELYVGEKGNGAYKNGKKIMVSPHNSLKECSISFDSSIRYSPEPMLRALEKLSKEVFNIRMFGSSVRALTYLAEGVLDFSVEFHDRPWDFAGSVTLIEEAGGKLTDLWGKTLTYKTIGYIASNQRLHEQVRNIVESCF
jgi:fructose-1,6-bisphosphatase/inositol monophosphatase family enzyme